MSTSPFSRRTMLRGTMAAGVAAAFAPLPVQPVFAEPVAAAATNGYLAFLRRNGGIYRANADGTGAVLLAANGVNIPAWTVDGSRVAYLVNINSAEAGLWTVRFDGSNPVHLTLEPHDQHPAFSPAGRFVYFSRAGQINAVTADGSWLRTDLIDYSGLHGVVDRFPNIVAGRPLIFERKVTLQQPAIYRYVSPTTQTLLIAEAACGAYSPDGTKIAYINNELSRNSSLWVADSEGANGVQIGTFNGIDHIAWAPDGLSLYLTREGDFPTRLYRITLDGTVTTLTPVGDGAFGSMQPVTSTENRIIRTWGPIALDTAIAISKFNWANHDAPASPDDQGRLKAGAVVIGRGDQFYDALAGSALAANKGAPLLITPPSGLYAPARTELQRVLAPGGTVYLLGGTAAISTAIETAVKNLGYKTVRCGGVDMFDTAVKINQQITSDPQIIIIATGAEFYDALAAGAAAGAQEDAVVVLTNGTNMPVFSAAYLNSIDPVGKLIITAGGPGDAALYNGLTNGQIPNWANSSNWGWYGLIGADAIDTALKLADFMFAGPQIAAVATSAGWYDALTGGAMVGNNYGPLLLTPPGALDSRVARYLNNNSSNISYAVVLGGTAALAQARVPEIGANIAIAGRYLYEEVTPTSSAAPAANARRADLTADQFGSRATARSADARHELSRRINPRFKQKRWSR